MHGIELFIYNEKYNHTDGMLVLARPSHSFLAGRADHTEKGLSGHGIRMGE